MRFPSIFYRLIAYLVGAFFIGQVRGSLDFGSIGAGLQARLTLTLAGVNMGDEVTVAPETDIEAGLAYTCHVSAANTVTVTMINNTAGSIDPAPVVYKARISRRAV